ncbi:MAG TPA: choice-of-anchor D domain-containing protein [Polyangiaceae bacterium]
MRRTSVLVLCSALTPSGALLAGCFSGSSGGNSPEASFNEPDTATFDQETPDAEAGPTIDATADVPQQGMDAVAETSPLPEAGMDVVVVEAGPDVVEAGVIDAPMDVVEEEAGVLSGTFATGPVVFPPVACGSQGQSGTYTFLNTGTLPITWSATLTQGTFFTIKGASSGTVPPGQTGSLTVAAGTVPSSTTAGTTFNDSVVLTTNVPGYTTVTVPVSDTAAGGTLTLVPSTVSFGQVQLSKTTPLPFTLTNTGNAPVSVTVGTPTDPQFAVSYAGAPGAVTLAAGASLGGAQAAFTPSATGMQQATSAIQTTGAICGTSVTSVPMNGVGTTAPVTVNPGLVDFGPVACGRKSTVSGTVTITNGYSFLISYTATLGLGGASPYTVDVPNGTVAANGTTVLHLTPAPIPVPGNVSANAYGDTLTVTTNAPSTPPASVTIDESAFGAILSLSMPSTSFGNVNANTPGSLPFTVNNTGNAAANLTLSTSGGGFAASFGAGGSIAGAMGGASGNATFTPSTPGPASGTMTIATSDVLCSPPLGPITLNANALVPIASYSAAPITTSVTCTQGASQVQLIAVSNDGNAPLTLSNVTSLNGRLTITTVPPPIPPGQSANIAFVANAAAVGTDMGGSVVDDAVLFTTNETGSPADSVPVHIQINGANLEYLDANGNPTTVVYLLPGCNSTNYSIANTGNVSVSAIGDSPYPGGAPGYSEYFNPGSFSCNRFAEPPVGTIGNFQCGATVAPGSPVSDTVWPNPDGEPEGGTCSGADTYTFTITDGIGNPGAVCIPLPSLTINWAEDDSNGCFCGGL